MTSIAPKSLKTVHVIGDSHVLGFKGKSIVMSEFGLVINTSVLYVRGLTADKLVQGQQLHPELVNYFLQQGIITKEGVRAAASADAGVIAEQYSGGTGFQRPVALFCVGEIFIRKYLGSVHERPDVSMSEIHAKFSEVAQKYLTDIKAIQSSFGIAAAVHEICPPTGDDGLFEAVNNFRCPRELRATLYRMYNRILFELAGKLGITFCRSADYLDVDGFLAKDYELDGVHADHKFTYTSLERTVLAWLHTRTADHSDRYIRWCEASGLRSPPPVSRLAVSDVFMPFDAAQIAALRESMGEFEFGVCKNPALDWAHAPVTKGYRKYHELIKYGDISPAGLKILHDVLIAGSFGDRIRSLLGAKFSIINARPVQSFPHADGGIGQQTMHRDGCPAGVYRALIYLVDVDDDHGPFEYMPSDAATTPTRVLGKAGSTIIFDANAVLHRATPPRAGLRYALDIIFLVQPEGCLEIAHGRKGLTWPVDPYLFEVSDNCYPPLPANRWFYPALVRPQRQGKSFKMLTPEEMAPAQKTG
jgi:hypothetical protein